MFIKQVGLDLISFIASFFISQRSHLYEAYEVIFSVQSWLWLISSRNPWRLLMTFLVYIEHKKFPLSDASLFWVAWWKQKCFGVIPKCYSVSVRMKINGTAMWKRAGKLACLNRSTVAGGKRVYPLWEIEEPNIYSKFALPMGSKKSWRNLI